VSLGGALLGGDVAVWLEMGGIKGGCSWMVTWQRGWAAHVVMWWWWWVVSLSSGESTSMPWLGPSVGIDQGPNDGDRGRVLLVVVVMGRKVSVTNV